MNYYVNAVSHSSTGVKTETCGFQPVKARITVGGRFATTESTIKFSDGHTDGTFQLNHSLFADSTGRQTISKTDRMVSVWERVSGTLTEVVRVNFSSFTATEFKYNVVTANVNYQLFVEVEG